MENPASNPYVFPTQGSQHASVTEPVVDQLVGTKPWVQLMSVLFFIGGGFGFLGGIALLLSPIGPMRLMGLLYMVFSLIYLVPGMKLWSYGSGIGRLRYDFSEATLVQCLSAQRGFWKFVGILTVVSFVIVAIAAGGLIVTGLTTRAPNQEYKLKIRTEQR